VPAVAQTTVSVAVPEPVMLVTLRVAEIGGEVAILRLTVPLNPLRGVIVTVVLAVVPARHVRVVEPTLIWKSWIVTATVAVCVKPLLEPVIVTT